MADDLPDDDPATIAYQNRDANADAMAAARSAATSRNREAKVKAQAAAGVRRQRVLARFGLAPLPGEEGYDPGP
jgi:hypothetical protein